jgi:hypothetical protein
MNEILPDPVYALLSGLNASTVGIIALAAVQLAEKAITDRITRILVIFGACAGLCYNALWYFPILMVVGGFVTVVWDNWLRQGVAKIQESVQKRRRNSHILAEENTPGSPADVVVVPPNDAQEVRNTVTRRAFSSTSQPARPLEMSPVQGNQRNSDSENGASVLQNQARGADTLTHVIPLKIGVTIILTFFGMSTNPSPFIPVLIPYSDFRRRSRSPWDSQIKPATSWSLRKHVPCWYGYFRRWPGRHPSAARICC